MSAMASLLAKFRIDYSDLQLISDITKKPQESTIRYFKDMIKEFMQPDEETNGLYISILLVEIRISVWLFIETISESDLLGVQDKTNRHLRLREYVLGT